jgi:hypothetical protein
MEKKVVTIFELPQRLGILQHVEYEPFPREWCTDDWCPHEGALVAEGCRKGVCIKYRVRVYSKDGKKWEAKKQWRKRKDEEASGCLRQQVADALWELADRFDVGVWYRRIEKEVGIRRDIYIYCGPLVNGVELGQPHCRAAEECAKQIIEDYRRELEILNTPPEILNTPPPPDPVEELLRRWPELEAFGAEWVRKWLNLGERLIEIAKVIRRFPWMADVVRQNPMNILNPYTVNAFVAKDGSESCLQLSTRVFCLRDGKAREVKLELEFKRYEEYEGKMREVYRPKGLLAFAVSAKEYVEIL